MSLFKPTFWQIPLVSLDAKDRLVEKTATLQQRLHQIADNHHDARFASSLAVEDMVITDVIARENLDIGIFTLDTGLLHQDTLNLLDNLEKVYPHLQIERFQPIADEVTRYEEEKGKFAFYESVELRRECCHIRKIEPLNRAYILANNVPYNDLYHQGFPSIGCEPCTRQVKQGEDIRAGRWWWESKDSKECGLHK